MVPNLSKLKWGWVVLGVLIAYVISFGASFCVVTVYATSLAFQNQGAPDMAAINVFAAALAPTIQGVFIGVGTFAGGLLAARRAKADALSHGIAVGSLTALVVLVFS